MAVDITPKMVVREIMSSPVITVQEGQNIVDAAKIMELGQIGAVIVTEKEGKPVGVLTEHDIVVRVVAKGLNAHRVKVSDAMTTPLRTVDPEMPITDAARVMSRYNMRRLGIVYKGDLVGIVTSRDILHVTPELFEILQEQARIETKAEEAIPEGPTLAGYCDRCGAWSDNLREYEGEFLCEDCREEREEKA